MVKVYEIYTKRAKKPIFTALTESTALRFISQFYRELGEMKVVEVYRRKIK